MSRGIWEEELICNEFERLFKKKYLFEMYYDDIAKEFHEMHMGSMTNNENTTRVVELLKYVPYVKD